MSEVNKAETGKRIREMREIAAETQEDLAKLLNVKRQIISYYENGTRVPNLEHLIIIAEHYDTTTDYILGLSDVSTTNKDLQFICDYTGLNEYAVGELHKLKKLSTNKLKALVSNISLLASGQRVQDAKLDLEFINSFLSSPYNAVFNHRDSYLYEYCKNLDNFIDLYDEIINFEIKENYDNSYLFQQFHTFENRIDEAKKKIRIDKYLITDDFAEALDFFVNNKLCEIEEKEKVSSEKLNLIYKIIIKKDGENNVNNP